MNSRWGLLSLFHAPCRPLPVICVFALSSLFSSCAFVQHCFSETISFIFVWEWVHNQGQSLFSDKLFCLTPFPSYCFGNESTTEGHSSFQTNFTLCFVGRVFSWKRGSIVSWFWWQSFMLVTVWCCCLQMGVADIQSANEDLKKQLDDKQQLIKQLTQQIVVSSSLSSTNGGQKKKMRRETWCAPKVQRKSYCKIWCLLASFVWRWVGGMIAWEDFDFVCAFPFVHVCAGAMKHSLLPGFDSSCNWPFCFTMFLSSVHLSAADLSLLLICLLCVSAGMTHDELELVFLHSLVFCT